MYVCTCVVIYSWNFHTEVSFLFSEDEYSQLEMPNATMAVRVMKRGALLAHPVWLRITPQTIEQALEREIISSFEPPDNALSPNRASTRTIVWLVISAIMRLLASYSFRGPLCM